VASDAERSAIERLADVVASELNVKELDFVHTEAELVSYRVRPNYRALGPRFGKEMPQAAAAIEALDAAALSAALELGEEVGIQVDGKDHTLSADDVNLVMEPLEGYQLEAEAGHAVALELDLDDELRREGLAREVVRAVQEARKQAGLEVSDRISLELSGDDELLEAAREHEAYIAGETLATSVGYGADGAGEPATIEGRELLIAVSKV
jgi:isoleucyl-tRNA synthetase